MAHNPPRPQGLSPEAARRVDAEVAARPTRSWYDIAELAEQLYACGKAGKHAKLSPNTAMFISGHLRTVGAKPTRDDIAKLMCRQRCQDLCTDCRGKANVIVHAYGCSIEPITKR